MPRDRSGLVEILRSAIEDSELSFSAIAAKAGIDHRAVGRFVAGERDLTLSSAAKICEVLGLELREPIRPKGRPKKKL